MTRLEGLALARHGACPWVFPAWHGTQPVPMESAWSTARAKAGLADVHFHGLRHTFASYMAMSGATLREIAEVLGHKNIQMRMRYSHLFPSHTTGVVQRMAEQFLDAPVAAPVALPPSQPSPVVPSVPTPTPPLSLELQVFEAVRAVAPLPASPFQVAGARQSRSLEQWLTN